jgi:hypothetical protein
MEVKFYDETPFSDESLAELFISIYGGSFNFSNWKWRSKENPLESSPNIAYIQENNKLISFYSVSQSEFINNGKIVKCGLMNSAMTHPDYRGKGLYAKTEVMLHNHIFNKKSFDFLYGFANHNSHRIHIKQAGWKDLFVLNNFYCKSKLLLSLKLNTNPFNFNIYYAKEYNFNSICSFQTLGKQYGFNRSSESLRWRLALNPRNNYQILEITNSSVTIGLIVYKQYNKSIDIMEVFVKNLENYFDILKQSLILLSETSEGIYIWSNLYSEEHLYLESIGFQESEFNTYFGYISNKMVLDREKIHFRFIDSDVY